jgi:hypothetical protein
VSERCSWCGRAVPAGDGYRAYEGDRRAAFCRLEHVVPWALRGARWESGPPAGELGVRACSWCGAPEPGVLLERTRGRHRVPDGFCSLEHLLAWAKAGGRYR